MAQQLVWMVDLTDKAVNSYCNLCNLYDIIDERVIVYL